MKKAIFFFILLPNLLVAQKWVDTTYQIKVERNINFGSALDFAGNVEHLKLDIAYPSNDTPPSCGRPMVVVIYGGAWMAGDKSVGEVQRLMEDFAKRGYVAIAPNYRLGMFQTALDWNCNISNSFDIEWNCLNAQDSSEWYRAYYRAVQDVKGALRYMVNKQDDYSINPNNIFTTGFSAGGFTALGVAFLDHPSEWSSLANSMTNAKAPNSRYDAGCVKKYGWDTDISSMNLARPSLGNLHGDLNYPASSLYKIKAAGNLFGGMMYNLLDSGNSSTTGIYSFHQPNDLIVPYQNNRKVFHGLNACAYAFCNLGILNRPVVYSSPIIRDWAADASVDFHFDSTTNTTDCAGQIANPSKGGHQLDNWSRTWNMATYFASKIDTTDCEDILSATRPLESPRISIYPNPANTEINVSSSEPIISYTLTDMLGKVILSEETPFIVSFRIDIRPLISGVYILDLHTANTSISQKIHVR